MSDEEIPSGHERIPGRVAKDPEEDQEHKPGPKINWRNEKTPLRPPGYGTPRESQKAVDDERQRQHHERIELERGNRVQVDKLIARARRAATGTLETGQQPKRAFGEELIARQGWIKKKQEDTDRCESQPNKRRDRQLARAVGGRLNKVKASHDLKGIGMRRVPPCLGIVPVFVIQRIIPELKAALTGRKQIVGSSAR